MGCAITVFPSPPYTLRGFPTRLSARKDPSLHETCGPMQALNKDTPVIVALAKVQEAVAGWGEQRWDATWGCGGARPRLIRQCERAAARPGKILPLFYLLLPFVGSFTLFYFQSCLQKHQTKPIWDVFVSANILKCISGTSYTIHHILNAKEKLIFIVYFP